MKTLILDIEAGGFKAGELAVFAVKPHTGRADVFHPLVPQQLPVLFDAAYVRRAFMKALHSHTHTGGRNESLEVLF